MALTSKNRGPAALIRPSRCSSGICVPHTVSPSGAQTEAWRVWASTQVRAWMGGVWAVEREKGGSVNVDRWVAQYERREGEGVRGRA